MVGYIVIRCPRCGQPLIAKQGQKTKRCTYCKSFLNLSKLRILVIANSAREARYFVISTKNAKASR